MKERLGRYGDKSSSTTLTPEEKMMYREIFGHEPPEQVSYASYSNMGDDKSELERGINFTIENSPGYKKFGERGVIWRVKPEAAVFKHDNTGESTYVVRARFYAFHDSNMGQVWF